MLQTSKCPVIKRLHGLGDKQHAWIGLCHLGLPARMFWTTDYMFCTGQAAQTQRTSHS